MKALKDLTTAGLYVRINGATVGPFIGVREQV